MLVQVLQPPRPLVPGAPLQRVFLEGAEPGEGKRYFARPSLVVNTRLLPAGHQGHLKIIRASRVRRLFRIARSVGFLLSS